MRVAFVTPLPGAPSGIADYAADVIAALAPAAAVDAYHEQPAVETDRLPPGCVVRRAAELPAEHARRPYDAIAYQLGNGLAHAFQYALLPRLPGLLVLHDLVLHHSRARMLLDDDAARAYAREPWSAERRQAAGQALALYASEVAYSHPTAADRLVHAQMNTIGDLLPYAYPLFRLPVEAARAVAVHNRFMADAVRDEVPEAEVAEVAMPIEPLASAPGAAAAVRARHGLAPDAFVVGCFGLLTREKQVGVVAQAVARAAVHLPGVRLLLVGDCPERAALDRRLERAGVAQRAVVAGRVPFAELAAYLEACDLVAHLRYPTARETSAALLRALAQGRPTVMSDLANLAEVPGDAVVRADPTDEEGELLRAILRLAGDAAARAALGARARAYVAEAHSPARCRQTYLSALRRAAGRPAPRRAEWPAHWRDGAAR